MRLLPSLSPAGLALALALCAAPALAQVGDAERAAARELFKQGDELQHQGHLAEALDKFQRAQQVVSAPTNLLRIAECQAGLGKLVEATETYRLVIHTPLAADAPPAFRAAVDQAKNELPQLEPLVPRLTIDAKPANLPATALQIDGQAVPAALLGTPIPLDPGSHTVAVVAPGFTSTPQRVTLMERESKAILVALQPVPAAPVSPYPSAQQPPPYPPPAPTANTYPAGTYPPPPQPIVTYGQATPYAQTPASPAPPPKPPEPEPSRTGVLAGLHLGDEFPGGAVPNASGGSSSLTQIASSGLAFGVDGGLRFARNWYIGAVVEHAELDNGASKSDTTALGAQLSIITNPDRVSFYLTGGAIVRWYSLHGAPSVLSGGDGLFGVGVWIPIGSSVRLLPEFTASFGSFSQKTTGGLTETTSSDAQGHEFYMLGLAGFYNLDF